MNMQAFLAVGTITVASLMASAGGIISWDSATSGNWGVASNWAPELVPGIDDDVFLGLSEMYTVTVNSFESARTLSITNPQAGLTIDNAQMLSVFGALSNDGRILVNPISGGAATTLFFGADASLNGSGAVVLNGFGARARIQTAPGQTLFHGAPHTIKGQGQIEAQMVNDGLVSADVVGSRLVLMTNPMSNNSVLQAVDGSTLDILGITLTQGTMGIINAQGLDSEVLLTGATVIGGRLTGSDGGGIVVSNASTLDGVESACNIELENSHILNIRNSITNDGVITVNPISGDSETAIVFLDNSSFDGTGRVVLNGFGARACLQTDGDRTMTNSFLHTIEGQGQIQAKLINQGLVSANIVGTELVLMTNDKTNNGTMQALNGARLTLLGITVSQVPGPSLDVSAGNILAEGFDSLIQVSGSTIMGGNVESYEGARIVVTGTTTFDDVRFSGELDIQSSHRLILKGSTTNNGTITVNPVGGGSVTALEWGDDEMILEGEGTILLAADGARAVLRGGSGVELGGIGPDQRLEGDGRIELRFINQGTIAPGFSHGTMSATQPVVFTETASYEAQVDMESSDMFNSISTIELGGSLDVSFIDGFDPQSYWARTIMQGSFIFGEFDTLNIPPAPFGLVTRVFNTGTEYIIGQTCQADLNLDGQLNFFDVSTYLDAYNAMDPVADMTGDGIFNFFDISVFLGEFANGCVIE